MDQAQGARSRVRELCPGVIRPMETGDGYLVRLRHPIGGLSPQQARAVAEVARRHGSGELELTRRGNLQLRGFPATELVPAQQRLVAAGLGDSDPRREAVPNVMASPAADRDPEAVADIRPLARELTEALASVAALEDLPPKVGLVVDGGGRARLDGLPSDLRLEAAATASGVRYRLAVGGSAREATVLGWIGPSAAVSAAQEVLERFLALRARCPEPPRRLGEAVRRFGTDPLMGSWEAPGPSEEDPIRKRSASEPMTTLGPDSLGGWTGAAFPFGVLNAAQVEGLAELVDTGGCGTLRLTPWRAVLLTRAREEAQEALALLGAITDPGDRRLALNACVGAPGCSWAYSAARDDARTFEFGSSGLLEDGARVHVSGCEKGCGRPTETTVTLTAGARGYDLSVRGEREAYRLVEGLAPATADRWLAALGRILASERRAGEDPERTVERLDGPALALRLRREAEGDK